MNGYVPNYIEEIKRRLSIVDVVGQKVSLKKSGRNFRGLCPFHAEKSGSFYVWPDSESYFCFGCKESGDIFNFIMKTEGLAFGEALEQLAGRAGVQLPERQATEDPEVAKRRQQTERLSEAMQAATTYYQNILHKSNEAAPARDYLKERGVSEASVESFGLGYALGGWDNLLKYLNSRGFKNDELLAAGLIGERENGGGFYDRFRERVIFPIRDRQGKVIAFGGRVLSGAPKDVPKYLNSPQTPLFDKSNTLYGLDLAKESIRRTDRVVVVEGYLDVLMCHQYGHSNVVAALGTALGEKHIAIIKKLTKRIVLALDADTAGQMATLKGIEVLKQGFDTLTVPVPTARGLIRFEQQLDADVRIATLPAGKDPDDVAKEGGSKWRELIDRALPVVDYYFSSVTASVDLNSARGKSEAVEKLIPAILEVHDRIQREHYLQKLARLAKVDAGLLRSELNRAMKAEAQNRLRPHPAPLPTTPEPEAVETFESADADAAVQPAQKPVPVKTAQPLELEDMLLAFLLRYYSDALSVEAADGEPVREDDFIRSENRLVFEVLQKVNAGEGSLDDFEENLNPELAAHLERLRTFSQAEPEIPDLVTVQETLRFQLNRLREVNLRRLYEQGTQALEESEVASPEEGEAGLADSDHLWVMISTVSDQLKQYYPPKSMVFRDSRDR
ncbi:MAG: DNA primase [Chloroflexi bacterium]|nr:DNA primase [Chloroflexota bacterium]OJW02669.1 MAG: DNA primase [Chloroflexi bacterium 54-19]